MTDVIPKKSDRIFIYFFTIFFLDNVRNILQLSIEGFDLTHKTQKT